jgi:hypothetical protein
VTSLDVGQYVTIRLSRYPKYKSDVWIITRRYLVHGVVRFNLENVTGQHSRFTRMKRLFEEDLQAAPLQLELDMSSS